MTFILNKIRSINHDNFSVTSASLLENIEKVTSDPYSVLDTLMNYIKAKLLIIEDAGVTSGDNGIKEASLISYILNTRVRFNLPTIITTPLNRKDLSSYLLEDSLDIIKNKWDTFYFLYGSKHIRKYSGN